MSKETYFTPDQVVDMLQWLNNEYKRAAARGDERRAAAAVNLMRELEGWLNEENRESSNV